MNDQGDVATALSDYSYLRGINCAEPSLQLWRVPATETHDDSSFLSPGLCLGIAQPARSEEFGA
jgi:hypothetical protein